MREQQPITFDDSVARHVLAYRPPEGRVHPETATVPNPHIPARTRARLKRVDRIVAGAAIGTFGTSLVAALASGAGLVTGVIDGNEVMSPIEALLMLPMLSAPVALLCGIPALLIGERLILAGTPAEVSVPRDVAEAYRAFQAAPERLRAINAADSVVAEVENQAGHMDALLVQMVRLAAEDAADSDTGVAVRNRIVCLAAQAQALVEMDRRRHHLALAADEADALVGQPMPSLGWAAATVAAETDRLELVLDACAADRVVPAVLEAARSTVDGGQVTTQDA